MASKADRARKGSRAGVAGWLTVLAAASGVALVPAAVLGAGPAQPASAGGPAARGSQAAPSGNISTVAGGVGGPAKVTKVAMIPCGVASAGGSLYVSDLTPAESTTPGAFAGGAVRKVSPTGRLTTPVGTGALGPLGDGGLASKASLRGPNGVAFDHPGNMVIADTYGSRVRFVAAHTGTFFGQAMTAGHVYTVASGLGQPSAVAVDGAGNLVVADQGASEVDVVAARTGTFYGQKMKAGHLYVVAGTGTRGYSGDGGQATSAELDFPQGVAVDGAGNILIADRLNNRIRVVAVGTGTFYGKKMKAGDIYTVAGTGGEGYSGDGVPATSAELDGPIGVAVDGAGNLVIADNSNERVRVVAAHAGTFYGQAMKARYIYTVAGTGAEGYSGDGGPAIQAEVSPFGVTVDGAGNLVIADTNNNRVRVVAAKTGTFYGQKMITGDIYTVAGTGQIAYSGDGGPATRAELNQPWGALVDGAGNLVISDFYNNRVRVAAARTGTFYDHQMTAGHIYTVAGTGVAGFSGDRGPATSAELHWPAGVAVDGSGNLLIADLYNNVIRVVAAHTGTFYGQAMKAGFIYTVAGGGTLGDGHRATSADLLNPAGVAVDGSGNLLIADTVRSRIRVVAAHTGTFYGQAMKANFIYSVAGIAGQSGYTGDGIPATSAELNFPDDVTADGSGNLVIADTSNNRIRVVAARTGTFYGQKMQAGDIYSVAGDGTPGFLGDGGPATLAELNAPRQVAVDGAGNLVIADTGNNRIRITAATNGTFYGRAMKTGHIYTVTGNGKPGFAGDGGPGVSAELNAPEGVAIDGSGLVIADSLNNRIRMVAG